MAENSNPKTEVAEDIEKENDKVNPDKEQPEQTASPESVVPQKSKGFFRKAIEWAKERLSKIANAIKERITTKDGDSFLRRLEVRAFAGQAEYAKLYNVFSKEEAEKAVLDERNTPSKIADEIIKEKNDIPERKYGIRNGETLKVADAQWSTSFVANAFTLKSPSGDTLAGYQLKSEDNSVVAKFTGLEPEMNQKELVNVKEQGQTFAKVAEILSYDLDSGKSITKILPDKEKPFARSADIVIDDKTIKVRSEKRKDDTVKLTVYDPQSKSSIEINGASSFREAIEKLQDAVEAVDLSIVPLQEIMEEKYGDPIYALMLRNLK